MTEWPVASLGEMADCLDTIRRPVRAADRRTGIYPYYGASGVIDQVDDFLFDGTYTLVAEDGENLRSRKTPIAFLARGRFWVNNHAHVLAGTTKSDVRFLAYLLQHADVAGYLTGSTQPKLTQHALLSMKFRWPPISDQHAIASILGALDDKIDANDRSRRCGDDLLKTLFQQLAGPALAYEAEADPLPSGWHRRRLSSVLATLETGSRPRGGVSSYSNGVPSLGAESIVGLARYDFGKTKYVPVEYFDAMRRGIVQDRDVLLYKDGGRPGQFEPHVALLGNGFPFERFCINEHVYRLRASDEISQEFLYFWLSSEPILEEMRRRGTGVAIPGLNSAAVKDLPIDLPPPSVIQQFTAIAGPLVSLALESARESRALAQLRDAMLPKFLSGELRIRDAEAFVEEAV